MSLEAIIKQMKGEHPLKKEKDRPDTPYYIYTGPTDTRENDNWEDKDAYRRKKQETPTGSIHIVHQDIEMLCRVTDSNALPGFLITCKDSNGRERELHVFFNNYSDTLTVCTSNKTDVSLTPDSRIRQGYAVPFVDELT